MRAMASTAPNNERVVLRAQSSGLRNSQKLRDAISAHYLDPSGFMQLRIERTQQLLQQVEDLDTAMEDVTEWVHMRNLPVAWRRQALAQLKPVRELALSCQAEVLRRWGVLRSPPDIAKLEEFDRRLDLLEHAFKRLASAIEDGKTKLRDREELVSCRCIQLWTRQQLAKRGFYTRELKLSRHHRGLVPGLFDSIGGTSKLTTHRQARRATLEYPTSDANWDSFRSPRRQRRHATLSTSGK